MKFYNKDSDSTPGVDGGAVSVSQSLLVPTSRCNDASTAWWGSWGEGLDIGAKDCCTEQVRGRSRPFYSLTQESGSAVRKVLSRRQSQTAGLIRNSNANPPSTARTSMFHSTIRHNPLRKCQPTVRGQIRSVRPLICPSDEVFDTRRAPFVGPKPSSSVYPSIIYSPLDRTNIL